MLLKVPNNEHQTFFEEVMSHQPEPMNRRFPERKSRSEAIESYVEKKRRQKEGILFPPCRLQTYYSFPIVEFSNGDKYDQQLLDAK